MRYRTLGRTGLRVSEVGLGGEWFKGLTVEQSIRIIDQVQACGMNYMDIFMPEPEIRDLFGQALAGRREQFLIQGHLCAACENGQYVRTRDREKTRRSFEDLLTRLRTDYIDIGMLHYVDSMEDYQAVFETELINDALALRKAGVIRFLGMSSHNPLVALRAVESGLIDVLMFSINPAYDLERPETELNELFVFLGMDPQAMTIDETRQRLYTACEASGVAITVMKALGAGTLLRAESSPFGRAMTVPQCVRYALDRSGVRVVLIGCRSPEEVLEASRYDQADPEELDYSTVLTAPEGFRATGRCMYCNHCLPCPAGIDIGTVTKFLDMAEQQKMVPDTVGQHYWALNATAEDCLNCGRCEQNCPFKVPVRKKMERAQEIFRSCRPAGR